MPALRFTRRAERDLADIGRHTLAFWGPRQAAKYLNELESFCLRLAKAPRLGRACDDLRPGLLRREHDRHVVFYRVTDAGVVIVRVLHDRMLPTRHTFPS